MSALKEVKDCRQVPGEPRRRWFSSDLLELIVWCDEAGAPSGFQLCYDKGRLEHALTWKPEVGFVHSAVDDGESNPGIRYKRTPILVPDGKVDLANLAKLFAQANGQLPADVAGFVAEKLSPPVSGQKADSGFAR